MSSFSNTIISSYANCLQLFTKKKRSLPKVPYNIPSKFPQELMLHIFSFLS
ncbi:hypothetical protein SCG7109_AR_00190, partial [Chlamydiales bacterium SCGC AG-110-M15]